METLKASPRGDDLAEFLSRAAAKERAKIEKHLATCDAADEPDRAKLWRRVALMLDGLSGAGVESASGQAWRFFIPDGKYRMQVFALEDRGDGVLRVCLPDVIDEAVKRKLLKSTTTPGEYAMKGIRGAVRIEPIESGGVSDPPAHVKSMLGWNRRAIQISLSVNSEATQVAAAKSLCELAARKWSQE